MFTKKALFTAFLLGCSAFLFAQVQINKPIQLTGGSGERIISNLETPVSGTDAANKDYVDAAVAAAGGGGPTMISDESSSSMTLGDARRYCQDLTESGHSDWYLPTYEELNQILSKGGVTVSSRTSANYVWFGQPINYGSTSYAMWAMQLSTGGITIARWALGSSPNAYYTRCVR